MRMVACGSAVVGAETNGTEKQLRVEILKLKPVKGMET